MGNGSSSAAPGTSPKMSSRRRGVEADRIIVLGLTQAGKTSILYKIKLGEVVETIPTAGCQIEPLRRKNRSVVLCDVGGEAQIGGDWQQKFYAPDAVVFVVDSCRPESLAAAQERLWAVLKYDALQRCPVLICANKQDLPEAVPLQQISDSLRLHKLHTHLWHLEPTSAVSAVGLEEGLQWLMASIDDMRAGGLNGGPN